MSKVRDTVEVSSEQVKGDTPDLAPPITEAPISSVASPEALEGNEITSGDSVNEQPPSNPLSPQVEPKAPSSPDPKSDVERRKSTIKHQDPVGPESPRPRSQSTLPPRHRRGSSASVQSRYSEMTMDYFESIPAKYNAYAGFFTWILLAGFVLGPSAQQAAARRIPGSNTAIQRLLAKAPLLYTSVTCSAIGMLGMIVLWIRWRRNYMWLIHKIFLPGALNGLAGTLAVAVNTWAIQIEPDFHINRDMIITLAITGGSTVVCLLLTFIYQLVLMSVKREHRRLVREADIEAATLKGTVDEHDFSDAKGSIWNAIAN